MKPSLIKIPIAKQLLMPIALSYCLFTITACKKQVEAVTVDPVTINPISDYEIVSDPTDAFKFSFKSLASKYKILEWRFGDDSLTTNPTVNHTYLASGKYTVDLKTVSETGNISHKYFDVIINPDSVIRLTTEKTAVPNQLKLGVTAKAPIASILWTFSDVIPAVTSTLLNPLRTYIPGTSNTVTVKIKTTSGSETTITNTNVTTEGILQDITQGRESYEVSADNFLNTVENSPKLLDGSTETKYTMGGKDGRLFTYPLIVSIKYSVAQTVRAYAIGNSNDNPPRDPKSWRVEGSNDNITWEALDTRTMTKNFYDQMTALGATTDAQRYKQLFFYPITTPKAYTRYRWVITANWGDAAMQMNEFRLYK